MKLTQPQLELWLNQPETKVYLKALQLSAQSVRRVLGSGSFVDESNADKTLAEMYKLSGTAYGYEEAVNVLRHLPENDLIDIDPEDKEYISRIESLIDDCLS